MADTRDRRRNDKRLVALEQIITRMEVLGGHAEDAAARLTDAVGSTGIASQKLMVAMGDVIDIASERSTLAHQAHRLIIDMREEPSEDPRRPENSPATAPDAQDQGGDKDRS